MRTDETTTLCTEGPPLDTKGLGAADETEPAKPSARHQNFDLIIFSSIATTTTISYDVNDA
jgi:hypothetical protein